MKQNEEKVDMVLLENRIKCDSCSNNNLCNEINGETMCLLLYLSK